MRRFGWVLASISLVAALVLGARWTYNLVSIDGTD